MNISHLTSIYKKFAKQKKKHKKKNTSVKPIYNELKTYFPRNRSLRQTSFTMYRKQGYLINSLLKTKYKSS